jgi:hypothetical protein
MGHNEITIALAELVSHLLTSLSSPIVVQPTVVMVKHIWKKLSSVERKVKITVPNIWLMMNAMSFGPITQHEALRG